MVIHPEIPKSILTKSFKKTVGMKQAFRLAFTGLHSPADCPQSVRPGCARRESRWSASGRLLPVPSWQKLSLPKAPPGWLPDRESSAERMLEDLGFESKLSLELTMSSAEKNAAVCPQTTLLRVLTAKTC